MRRLRIIGPLIFAAASAALATGAIYLIDGESTEPPPEPTTPAPVVVVDIARDVPGEYGTKPAPESIVRELRAPWTAVTLTTATTVTALAASIDGLEWVLRWDASRQGWDSWTPQIPASLGPPSPLAAGDAVWLRVASDTEFDQPPQSEPQRLELQAKWNLVGWNGSEATPAAVASLFGVDELWVAAPAANRFALFTTQVARLGAPRTVPYGSVIWVRAEAALTLDLAPPLRGAIPAPEATASTLLAASADEGLLYAVNTDPGTVTIVDVPERRALVELSVGREPRSIALDPRGGRAYVANFGDDTVSVLDVDRGLTMATLATRRHPYGIVVSPDAQQLYVAESGAASVQEYDTATLTPRRRFAVEEEPRGLAVSADGRRLLVTHFFTGRVSEIDLISGEVVLVHSTGIDSNAAQSISFSPGGRLAFLPMIVSRVSNREPRFDTTVSPIVGVVQPGREEGAPAPLLLSAVDRPVELPFALEFYNDVEIIYVVNSASNDVSVVELRDLSAVAHIEVGANPRAIQIGADGKIAYVLNALSYDVGIVDLEQNVMVARVPISTSPLPPLVQLGKELFFSSDRPDLALNQWVSCSVCHFEGLHDRRTWLFEDGPRNTPALRGLADTAPFHWSGDRTDTLDFQDTLITRQGGTGLSEEDNAALAAFLQFGEVEPSPNRDADGGLSTEAARGEAIFFAQGCGSCHAGVAFTDGQVHNVGTSVRPEEQRGGFFDTPSLLGLYDSAPYLHDGSAPSLKDLLTRQPLPHGIAAELPDGDLNALIAFLVALP